MSGSRWVALGVLCLSLLTIVVDNTIVNVALPALVRELDADVSQLQWVVDAYALVFAGLLLLAGALGDRYGRRRTPWPASPCSPRARRRPRLPRTWRPSSPGAR